MSCLSTRLQSKWPKKIKWSSFRGIKKWTRDKYCSICESGRARPTLHVFVYSFGHVQSCSMKTRSTSPSVCMRVHFMCVQWSKAVIGSSLLWLLGSISDRLSLSMATNLSGARPPQPPPPDPPTSPLPRLQTIHTGALRQEAAGRASDRWGAPPHPTHRSPPTTTTTSSQCPRPCSVLPCGSCHVTETPTLGCLCQQWPCALSLYVLFMGSREVARRVAGSGRAFVQHCGLYPALK